MKAAVYENYGPPEVVHIADVVKPQPKDGELLIKVNAAAVNTSDARIRGAKFPPGFSFPARLVFGLFKPRKKILGGTFAGTIEAVGKNVINFKVGEKVFGMTGLSMAAHAQYLTISENKAVVKIPNNLSFEEAAALPFGATTALYYFRDLAKIKKGQKILINGASGAVGTNAIQLAKYYGAEVTAVCSDLNHDLVKSLGADKVINYTKENFLLSNQKYDLILDTVGNLTLNQTREKLNENGFLLMVVAGLKDIIFSKQNVLEGTTPEKKEDIEFLIELINSSKLKVVIDKVYKLDEIVEAYKHVDTGHKKGNIVVSIN
jgi:NADPH:quinone reductase-like Zn-dependent oxidoreductase